MKPILTGIVAATLLATVVDAQSSRYFLQDLGTLPGATFSQASDMNDWGVVAGISATPEGTQHAVLWVAGRPVDIASRTRGGLNTGAFGINEWGQVSMQVETVDARSQRRRLLRIWHPSDVPGSALAIRGPDDGCGRSGATTRRLAISIISARSLEQPKRRSSTRAVRRASLPRFSSYRPVIWEPNPETIRQLPLLSGDTVGVAARINDKGQAVGFSGSCGDSALLPLPFGPHAVLWDKDGAVHDLGNLGAATVNIGLAINNRGEVVGASSLAADSTPFYRTDAFLWTRRQGMQDLGTLPGDVHSGATGINDRGEVVGLSGDGAGNIRAFHWQDGAMRDLNTLVPADAPVYLLFATAINADGAIAGWGVHKETGEVHAFKLIPVKER